MFALTILLSAFAILAAAAPGGDRAAGNAPAPAATTPGDRTAGNSPPPAATAPGDRTTVNAPPPAATTLSQCNTGDAQCCNHVGAANALTGSNTVLGHLGIVLQDDNVVLGLGCTPINVSGVNVAKCAQQPVCCSNNHFNGLVNVGCTPISL